MSFTDQKPRIATESDLAAAWGGEKNGKRFRCYMCGKKFQLGDPWRWVHPFRRTVKTHNGNQVGIINFLVCGDCDGDDVVDRWVARNQEYYDRFWWKE